MKKVSVIIPAYNKADLTVKTVESVLAQTYENIEVIVVDDGSTDNTKSRLKPYTDRIKYTYKENGGACSARNLGIRSAAGDYIALLDCDDTYHPQKIEKSINYLEKNKDLGFVHTPVVFLDKSGAAIRTYPGCLRRIYEKNRAGWIAKRLQKLNIICNGTVVAKKECFDKAGLFDEALFPPADWDMNLRMAEKYKAGYINEPLTLRASGGYIADHLEQSERECLVVLEKILQRNPDITERGRSKLISNVYLWHGKGYLKNNDLAKAKEELARSIKKYRFNFKALGLFIIITILGRNLEAVLKRFKVVV